MHCVVLNEKKLLAFSLVFVTPSEMTYIVSGGALISTHSLTLVFVMIDTVPTGGHIGLSLRFQGRFSRLTNARQNPRTHLMIHFLSAYRCIL